MSCKAILTRTVPCFCTSCHECTDDTVILSVGRILSRANNEKGQLKIFWKIPLPGLQNIEE